MNKQNKLKVMVQKIRILKHRMPQFATYFPSVRMFVKNRNGVSPVISSLILIAAVTALGLVALSYARSTSIDYQTDYAQAVNSGITKLKESLVYEYADYRINELSVYVLNSGSTNVTIGSISVNGSPISMSQINIHRMGNSQEITDNVIEKNVEVKINISNISTVHTGENIIKITSRSNSNFAYNFLA